MQPSVLLEPPVEASHRSAAWCLVCGSLVFAALSAAGALYSRGFLEADGCTHFLMSRFALSQPIELINIWGRPVVTGLYALPASAASVHVSLFLCRVLSLVMVLAMAGVTYLIAREQGYRHPQLAFVFLLAQPLLFLESMAVLTEIPFALILALAFLAYRRRMFLVATVLVSLLPLTRPEGFGFVLAAAALVIHRRWYWVVLLPLPLLGWNYAGWVLYGGSGPWWRWLVDHWPYAADSLYQAGPLWHFLVRLPVITSPLLFPALWIGMYRVVHGWRQNAAGAQDKNGARATLGRLFDSLRRSHRQWCELLILVLPLGILAVHSVLYWLGKMASNGELRYLLVVSPFWALLTAKGWGWTFDRLHWRRPVLVGALAALAPLAAQAAYPVVPYKLSPDWKMAQYIADWRRATPLARHYPNLMAAHPAIWFFLDRSPIGPHTYEWSRRRIDHPPAGTILIWDSVYGYYNSDQNRSVTLEDLRRAGWRENAEIVEECRSQCQAVTPAGQWPYLGDWHIFFSPR